MLTLHVFYPLLLLEKGFKLIKIIHNIDILRWNGTVGLRIYK